MARVEISLNGRTYAVGCEDGQEAHLSEIVAFVDSRMKSLAAGQRSASEAQTHILTMLMLADQIYDLRMELSKMRATLRAATLALEITAPAIVETSLSDEEFSKKLQKSKKSQKPDCKENVVTKVEYVTELNPEMEKRYTAVIESLIARIDAVASRLVTV